MTMKKLWIFLAGVGTGIVLLFVILVVIGNGTKSGNNGVTMFEQPGEEIKGDGFEVFQVFPSGDALAWVLEKVPFGKEFIFRQTSVVVLLPCDEGKTRYDDQQIKIPQGKCARQIGVYRYMANDKSEKTVPVVGIYDKKD